MKPKFGVVVFPGANCDYDAYYAVSKVLNYQAEFLWHKQTELKNSDVIILPGGFSYGDYLRTGAIARFSPILDSVISFAEKARPFLSAEVRKTLVSLAKPLTSMS